MRLDSFLARARTGSARGRVAELLVAADLIARDCIVSMVQADAPYDLVAERISDHRMFRLQVKTAYLDTRYKNARYRFNASSHGRGGSGQSRRVYEAGAFDLFAVYVPEYGILYIPHDGSFGLFTSVNDDLLTMTELPQEAA